ncbi:rRNA maturation RNase YbeY [Buchnera aphidicola]|uniref:Endoribonuclease YbeY n=1 Tax=Buchnera aphidicola subsp. Uroleucon sonchi TaxID=118118 RepID=A0A6C1FH75_BUCUN|nr:rRNA maturation RNase YbeY [Buchnera aphidicola]QIE02132.1 rRNA maturation RNase YbeY [Buchnera aphidicola (Uroleucon sonchi)]
MQNIIINLQKCCKNPQYIPKKTLFQRWIKNILNKKEIHIITIRVVDKKDIQKLNYIYRKINKPTNILAFPFNEFIKHNAKLLGDLVVCKSIIEQESYQYYKLLEAHWAHITIHGTLHLLGYDHKTKRQTNIMEQVENKIMASLNYPKPYI